MNEKTGLYKTKFILTNAYLCSANLKNNILMLKRLFGLLLCCSMLTAYAESFTLTKDKFDCVKEGKLVYKHSTSNGTVVTFTWAGDSNMEYKCTGSGKWYDPYKYYFTVPTGDNVFTWSCSQEGKDVKVSRIKVKCTSNGGTFSGSSVMLYDDNNHTTSESKVWKLPTTITLEGEPKSRAILQVITNSLNVSELTIDYTLVDAKNNVDIADEADLSAIEAGTYKQVTLQRAFSKGWNTICLPFSTTANVICDGAVAQRFVSYDPASGLSFARMTKMIDVTVGLGQTEKREVPVAMEANVPYLIWMPDAVPAGKVLTNVEVVKPQAGSVTSNGMTFSGNYAPHFHVDGMYGVVTDGEGTSRIVRGGSTAYVNGTRAYFTLADGQSLGSARLHFDTEADAPTAIGSIEAAPAEQRPVAVYDATGRLLPHAKANLEGLPRGIYIVGGRKVIK